MFTDFVEECRAHKALLPGDAFEGTKVFSSAPGHMVEPIAVTA